MNLLRFIRLTEGMKGYIMEIYRNTLWYIVKGKPFVIYAIAVTLAVRIHLFSYRTQKLSSLAPKILNRRRFGKIGCCCIHEKGTVLKNERFFFCVVLLLPLFGAILFFCKAEFDYLVAAWFFYLSLLSDCIYIFLPDSCCQAVNVTAFELYGSRNNF